jgi:hypothetical protein
MKIGELKSYLRLRGLRVSGRKQELVARTFSAMENNVQPVKTAEEVENEIAIEYRDKLTVDKLISIRDPFKIKSGWLGENEGVANWPMLLYPDIFNYLMFHPAELGSKDLNDYKNSKAYSYYKCGWLEQISSLSIGKLYCIMKADCRKSERINDPFHKLWILVNSRTSKIVTAHCTCMAGLSTTCNHVAAALFRIEAAVRNGLTNPSCTSSASEWLPCRKEVKPMKVKDMNFDRHDFGIIGKKKNSTLSTPKKHYNPLINVNRKLLSLTDIASALEKVAPNSIIHMAAPKPKIDFLREIISEKKIENTVASIDDILLSTKTIAEFEIALKTNMSIENIEIIEKMTQGQSTNESWFDYRKGVVTASKAHGVVAKVGKAKKGGPIDVCSLNQKVSGLCFVNPDIPALKYGRIMEVEAINCFYEIMRTKHRNLKIQECGLFLFDEMPFIGGSPDRIMTCSCCPNACIEVKCPVSINFTSPLSPSVKLPYLKRDGNTLSLNKNHTYFTQCQVQMGVTKLTHSFFMVWTPHGHFIETIKFDDKFWGNVKMDIFNYYNQYYLKSIFG